MATWDELQRIAMSLPEVDEQQGREGLRSWKVRGKQFVWERPLRRSDLEALGEAAPDGPILGARVPDLGAKEALVATGGNIYFTTPHFDGYPAILVELDNISSGELEELVAEAWLDRAPKRLSHHWLASPTDR